MYNYFEEMKNDVIDAIDDYFTEDELAEMDADELEEKLNEDLWVDDSVTGNASGSYTFSRVTAKEYAIDNLDLFIEACDCFCIDYETIGKTFYNNDWETIDVTIRCYLLGQVIWEVLEVMEA